MKSILFNPLEQERILVLPSVLGVSIRTGIVITCNLHDLCSVGFVAYWECAAPVTPWNMHTTHKCTQCVIVFFFTFIFYYLLATAVQISLRGVIIKSLYCPKSIDAPNVRKDGNGGKVLDLLVSLFWKISI